MIVYGQLTAITNPAKLYEFNQTTGPMKKITEAQLYDEYLLRDKSKAAYLTFGSGLAGAILCIVVFFMTERFLKDAKTMSDDFNQRWFEMTPEERSQHREAYNAMANRFSKIGIPLFLSANALWIIGAYAWSQDLRRNPSNKLIWKLGGILVLLTAISCALAWFLLIRLYMQTNG